MTSWQGNIFHITGPLCGESTCHRWIEKNMRLFHKFPILSQKLTHWGRVTHICVGKLTSIGSDNGLSPGRRQAIIRTNAGILLIRPLGNKLQWILVEILIFSFKKMHLKMSSGKWRPSCLGLNVLNSRTFHGKKAHFSNNIESLSGALQMHYSVLKKLPIHQIKIFTVYISITYNQSAAVQSITQNAPWKTQIKESVMMENQWQNCRTALLFSKIKCIKNTQTH